MTPSNHLRLSRSLIYEENGGSAPRESDIARAVLPCQPLSGRMAVHISQEGPLRRSVVTTRVLIAVGGSCPA